MNRFRGQLWTLAGFGLLFSFLSFLFVASVGGRSDGREIPFPAVLAESGCFVSGCHMTTGSTLNEVGSVSFDQLPSSFVPGETYDLGIIMTGGTTYGFQVATVFSDDTQAGSLTAVSEDTVVDEVRDVQILTQAGPLESGTIDFRWTAPMEPKEESVTLMVASNSSNANSAPTGDAINQREVSIPMGLIEKLYFAQFANGEGLISQISLLSSDSEVPVNAKLKLLDDDGEPLTVALNGEMVSGETEIFRIPAGGGAVFSSDGEGPVVTGSVTVTSDGPLSGVILFDGGAFNLGVAGVGNSAPMAAFRAPVESRSGDKFIRTGVAVVNLAAEENMLRVRLLDLKGTVVGMGTMSADPLPANGHIARFLDEYIWDDPAPGVTDFQGVLEVSPSNGQVAATVLRSSPGNLASLPVAPMLPSSPLLLVDFEAATLGDYTLEAFQSDWGTVRVGGLGSGRAEIIGGESAYSGRSLRLKYPAGTYGSADQAIQSKIGLARNYEELYVSYRVRFADDFDFVRGGKLPGLSGGVGNWGGNRPDGSDGWSGRMMWRPGGEAVQYVYHPDQPGIYGEDFPWNRRFEPGRWHTVEHRFVMNTPGRNDGVVQAWFDGTEALYVNDLRFRDVASFGISDFLISTFFGGGDDTWAPTKDEYISFDDFVVSTTRIRQ